MKVKYILLFAGMISLFISCLEKKEENKLDVDKELGYCNIQIKRTISELNGSKMMPRNIMDSLTRWKQVPVEISEWTVGFWPGILWYDYENKEDPHTLDYATYYTNLLYPLTKLSAYDHDLGFQIFCSYGNGYRLTGNENYKQIILNAADTLATLFNPKVGTILSWPREVEPNNWPHIPSWTI